MKKSKSKQKRMNRLTTRTHLLPLVAVGGSLAALPADAIELGDIVVQSKLGQPLRASIAYALAPNEQVSDSCIFLSRSTGGLPGIGRATVSVSDGTILISGRTALREPMVATSLVVDCPYTANLAREYMLFIDPPGAAYDTPTVVPAATAAEATAPVARAATRRPAAANRAPIGKSTRYRVQPGDSLSVIAQRIENRSIGLWPAVEAIFAANPDAFMDNDPNKLKAGSWLEIPSFDGREPVIAEATPAPVATTQAQAAPEPQEAPQSTIYEGAEAVADSAEPPVADSPAVDAVVDGKADATADLRPGDIILEGDSAFVDAGYDTIPATDLEGPTTTASSPNVPTAAISTPGTPEPVSSSWLMWLAGGGIAILFALVLLGGRLRQRFGSTPLTPAGEQAATGAADADTESIEAFIDDEYDLDDDSPTAENLALDADLIVGTGLEEGTDMEVAEDFGFASPTEVDIELPFEPEPTVATMQTDIIAPVHTDEQTILEREILPDDDDYDMSVIVDATKMPQPEDVTERDLQAIAVESEEDAESTDSYTINREPDFDILERDYEDEMTATQALNVEIERAAAQLADRDVTSEMPLATVTELDVTAQLPRRDEEAVDPDDTEENEAITVNISAEDKTEEMPAPGGEDTVEMEVESGKVDTKTG